MRKFVLLVMLLTFSIGIGQSNFEWDVEVDVPELTQSELLTKTKVFIANEMESTRVVNSVDPNIINLNSRIKKTLHYKRGLNNWDMSYSVNSYDVKFIIEDGKCRIKINNVNSNYLKIGTYEWVQLPASDVYSRISEMKTTNTTEERYEQLMSELKTSIQEIVSNYTQYISRN